MSPQPNEMPPWYQILPRLGTAAEFAAVRELFANSGFDYASVCGRVGAEHLYLLTNKLEAAYIERPIQDPLDALIRLFVIGRGIDASAIESQLSRECVAALETLHLIVPRTDGTGWYAPVMAHPTPGGAIMICDRNSSPEGVAMKRPPTDALYPALFANTLDFVDRFPQTPCENILEIGTGTGTAAIQWAKCAREVWATDITPRAVHFAEFNRRLAGADHVKVVQGDLYAPVEGLTFDRIAAHPPFVPARNSAVIFRDGGEDGEQIARRIVEGLPTYLRPGGLYWASFMISDRVGEAAEERIRKWLGAAQAEFDIGLAIDSRRTAAESIAHAVLNGIGTPEEICYFGELWKATRTEYLVHTSIVIRRQSGDLREPLTVRTQAGKGFAARHLEWLLDWELARRDPGFIQKFLESRPKLAPACELRATHRFEGGAAVSEDFTFEAEGPLRVACRVPSWSAKVLVGCDGSRTAAEVFNDLRAQGTVPQDADAKEFVRMFSGLTAAGVLAAGPA
jgi:SAM-dependent methyltransferase